MNANTGQTGRGLERLIFFTDAVAAIALTLLILPLVDAVPEAADPGTSLAEFLAGHGGELVSFLLSFAVIARLWVSHHRIFGFVERCDGRLIVWSFAWSLTIVMLPFFTEIIASFDPEPLSVALYVGTMALSSLCLTVITWQITHRPRAGSGPRPAEDAAEARLLRASGVVTALFFAALLIGSLVPVINYWALTVLFLSNPAERIWTRLRPGRATI